MFLLFFLIFLLSPRSAQAQIPLFHQLLSAYQPAHLKTIVYQPAPTPSVLADSTFYQSPLDVPSTARDYPTGVGGDGRVLSIALFGDSMIETLGPDLPTLVSLLQNQSQNLLIKILSHGYPSTNLEKAMTHLPDILVQKPHILVVESFAYNNFGNDPTGLDKHRQLLTNLIDAVSTQSPDTKIVLAATIAPNSVIFANNSQNFSSLERIEKTKTIKLYLENIIKLSEATGLPLADVYHSSLNRGNEGNLSFIDSTDNIHPSQKGQELFETTVAKTILDHNLIN